MSGDLDLRIVFLARASARLQLVEAGEMSITEAISGLIEPFQQIAADIPCHCECAIVRRWERADRQSSRRAAA